MRGGKQVTDAERAAAVACPATHEELRLSRLDAIKAYRERTGCSLGQAVEACKYAPFNPLKKSFKVEVIADNSGKWVGNMLRFATQREAEAYAIDLSCRWMAVRESRVVESDDAVTEVCVVKPPTVSL